MPVLLTIGLYIALILAAVGAIVSEAKKLTSVLFIILTLFSLAIFLTPSPKPTITQTSEKFISINGYIVQPNGNYVTETGRVGTFSRSSFPLGGLRESNAFQLLIEKKEIPATWYNGEKREFYKEYIQTLP